MCLYFFSLFSLCSSVHLCLDALVFISHIWMSRKQSRLLNKSTLLIWVDQYLRCLISSPTKLEAQNGSSFKVNDISFKTVTEELTWVFGRGQIHCIHTGHVKTKTCSLTLIMPPRTKYKSDPGGRQSKTEGPLRK